MFKSIFNRTIKPMEWGDQEIVSFPYLGIVIPNRGYYDRMGFLNAFTKKAILHRLCKEKKPIHVNYWYDGPCGNIGVRLWEERIYHRVKYSVIGISRLNCVDDMKTFDIAKNAVNKLIENNNIVLLLPSEYKEIEFYEECFPEAKKLSFATM
ncbi:hypothetical protein KQ41_06940 [Lysinibacillus fusiformis]|uniref:hypothetical protein n=1 Tax=Lysinibacillus fusiformis TaxID=28031 RepID=UPI0005005BA6|nr:hypothetical protein [Lysinibacillus fusiformis]KGA83765.1 hypothetical protein KQ41_06940 [Lysinibacillus fusiformis]